MGIYITSVNEKRSHAFDENKERWVLREKTEKANDAYILYVKNNRNI